MKKLKSHIIFICFWLVGNLASAQSFNLPIDDNLPKCIEENYFSNPAHHTTIRPLLIEKSEYDHILDSCFNTKKNFTWFRDKNFISKGKKYGFILNPVLTDLFGMNSDFYTENGVSLDSWISKKFNFHLAYTYLYLFKHERSDSLDYLPHFGKINSTSKNIRYQNLTGYLSWQVADFMNLQVGRDKVFWGDGYRSLFVSDNSNAYPFFKGTVDIWKVKYTILYSCFREKDSLTASDFNAKKYSASHILSWNIGKRLNFNMFETVIWRGSDSLGNRGFDVNYLNPIIFYRPVEFSLGSPDNVIMGFGFRLRLFKTTNLYGQFLLDEFKLSKLKAKTGWWGNKFGIQAGIKTYRLFGIKNLFALGEINVVKPFTYSHGSYMENNGNFSQPLAHPIGANFVEGITNLRYAINRWEFNTLIKLNFYGADCDTFNTGFNIYRSYNDNKKEYGNKLLQGQKYSFEHVEISAGYILNTRWHLSAKIGYRYYFDRYGFGEVNRLFYIGLYTGFGNREGLN